MQASTLQMGALDVEKIADGDLQTFMRAPGPLREGTGLLLDVRSAVKVTHVVLVEDEVDFLQAGRLTVNKNGRKITAATFGGEAGRTRTPDGHTVITLVPPLKLIHAPFQMQGNFISASFCLYTSLH